MNIKYLVLSDLHLGEEDSVFTNLKPAKPEPDPLSPSPCLMAFAAALESLIEKQKTLPYLVLLGDGLELALARTNEAVMVLERFLEECLVKRSLFQGLIYVPGNHDHHLWETAREIQYARYLAGKLRDQKELPCPWHISKVFANEEELENGVPKRHFVPSPLLNSIFERLNLSKFVGVLYPCFGIVNRDDKKIVCFHHGHLIEKIYLLMSFLGHILFEDPLP